jgi:hypothetical protein
MLSIIKYYLLHLDMEMYTPLTLISMKITGCGTAD